MRVMFIGKRPSGYNESDWIKVARGIGEVAADRNVHFIVGSDSPATLDRGVIDGASSAAARGLPALSWEVYEPDDSRARWRSAPVGFEAPLRRQRHERGDGRWQFAHLAALERADAVVAMGGHRNTRRVCRAAAERRIPCAPIPFFGGAAEEQFAYLRSRLSWEEPSLVDGQRELIRTLEGKRTSTTIRRLINRVFDTFLHALRGALRRRVYFISYSRKNSSKADHVEALLRRKNRGVLRDESAFSPGKRLREEIEQTIGSADDFVVLDSSHAADSEWVEEEIEIAKAMQEKRVRRPRRIVGVLLEAPPPKTSIPRDLLHLDGRTRPHREAAVERLIKSED